MAALAALPELRRLNLAANCLASLADSLAVPSAFSVLEHLDLSYNRLDGGALVLLAALPRLRELDVSGKRPAPVQPRGLCGMAAARSRHLRQQLQSHDDNL